MKKRKALKVIWFLIRNADIIWLFIKDMIEQYQNMKSYHPTMEVFRMGKMDKFLKLIKPKHMKDWE